MAPVCLSPNCPVVTAIFIQFSQISVVALRHTVRHMKPTVSPHDVVPSRIIKATFDTTSPSFQSIINLPLASDIVPACFTHAVLQPMHDKQNLDVNCLELLAYL